MIRLHHNSRDTQYRSPVGAQPVGSEVVIGLDAPEDAKCTLRLWTDEGEKKPEMSRDGDKFSCVLPLGEKAGLIWYYFIIELNGCTYYLGAPDDGLGGEGCIYDHEPPSWQITVYEPSPAPMWYKDAIVYQIFPDRFNRGSDWQQRRELSHRDENRRGQRRIWHEDWNDTPFYTKNPKGEVTRWDFFGGTLKGIQEKLGYLKELGVGAIYLNPIFKAASNHRYDTADYMEIDPLLGSEEDFAALCSAAHDVGIRIILDGVFSHTGADSRYFDYFGNYGGGAYNDQNSPYYGWYRFKSWPEEYECWWGVGDLPNVDEENPGYKDFIVNTVAKHWLRIGADGWRLDVADELPDSFIESFKTSIRSEKADSLLLGEVWEDASNKLSYGQMRKYLLGRELDSTMHYPFRTAVTGFLLGEIDANALKRRMDSIAENYPPEALHSALNLIGSHDRARSITVLGGAPEGLTEREMECYELSAEGYTLGRSRLMLAAILQFAMPGVPCIYYGDEAGVQGYADPFNRGTYPWGREDNELLSFYKALGSIYNTHDEFSSSEFEYLAADEDVFICRRGDIIAAVNRSGSEKKLSLCGTELLTGREFSGTIPSLGGVIIKTK